MKKRNEIIKEAIRDFYGKYSSQKDDLWYIRQNLKDRTYREGIEKSLRS